ncbi:hypothetical protein [Micromonospora zhanjiangensis]
MTRTTCAPTPTRPPRVGADRRRKDAPITSRLGYDMAQNGNVPKPVAT